jgi:hypothetical protein
MHVQKLSGTFSPSNKSAATIRRKRVKKRSLNQGKVVLKVTKIPDG